MTSVERKPIRQLSTSVINKIAAGEVIERPASVVKELLENSADAGATQIEVALEQGGTEMIRITDNGSGIPRDQLELAVTSHATSKIDDADDLFRVGTFGFRGEALASIAEVSQMTIRSRTAESDSGFELTINGGHREEIAPIGSPVGTSIEVRQLFYNTPVRRKFLKTPQTEKGHITEAFTRVAIANPSVQMTMLHNNKVSHQLPATNSWGERIGEFFGSEIADNLLPVTSTHEDIKISGYVVNPSVSRANNKMQYLFLNNRYIRDRSLQHALSEAYRGLLMTGRFPICFLRLEMPFEQVDVNVHPAKLEVRFQNGGQIYSQLLSTIRNKFLTTDLTAHSQLTKRTLQSVPAANAPLAASVAQQEKISFQQNKPAFDWTSSPRESLNRHLATAASSTSTSSAASTGSVNPVFPSVDGVPDERGIPVFERQTESSEHHETKWAVPTEPLTEIDNKVSRNRTTALQVHNTYLISESEEGMLVIDQHALHERIIYEQLREKVLAGKLEKQKMLVPEPVTLPPAEAAVVLQQQELLGQIGIDIEEFGGDTVLVSSYPAMLSNHNPAEMLRGVIDKLMEESANVDSRDLVDELLHMISCKAAVKAGDRLTPEEIDALLLHRELCQDSHHCPHGRPTSLVFSREDLDRRFKRI